MDNYNFLHQYSGNGTAFPSQYASRAQICGLCWFYRSKWMPPQKSIRKYGPRCTCQNSNLDRNYVKSTCDKLFLYNIEILVYISLLVFAIWFYISLLLIYIILSDIGLSEVHFSEPEFWLRHPVAGSHTQSSASEENKQQYWSKKSLSGQETKNGSTLLPSTLLPRQPSTQGVSCIL